MRDKVEQILLFAAAGISIVISVLDLSGLIEGLPFLSNRIPTLSLLILGIIVGYLALERRGKLDTIEELIRKGFNDTISSLKGTPVKRFRDSNEVYAYIEQRMREAREQIDLLAWGSVPINRETELQENAFRRYAETRILIATRKKIKLREIFTFPSDLKVSLSRLERIEALISKNPFSYQARYYDNDDKTLPPLLQVAIIDNEEVIVAFYRTTNMSQDGEVHLSIRQSDVADLFRDYYETAWRGAKTIKEAGNTANLEVLQELRRKLSNKQ
mgnify:CR=1 FL=1